MSKFHRDLSMLVLSRKNQDVSVGFDDMAELVNEINHKLQNSIYENKKYAEKLWLENEFAIEKKDNFFKENIEEVGILEQ